MLDTSAAVPNLRLNTDYKTKLIEVALPLQAINRASASEKSPQRGRPSTLHLWWARRPLTACRAILFASLVDDPSSHPELFPSVEEQTRERKRLFDIIEALVERDNVVSERVLSQAREEIRKSVGDRLPTVYDPFCGGGAIPIEAQRFGLRTLASDLNPLAVLITKALTEIPWHFKGHVPVHPSLRGLLHGHSWERATGLAADVEAYGKWILEQARERIGSHYPQIRSENAADATVISWLWARTIRCSNPLCGAEMPLIRAFSLSTRKERERYIEPIVDRSARTVTFEIRVGKSSREGTVGRNGARCIICNEPSTLSYIRSEGKSSRIGSTMIAIVAEGPRGRVYLPPSAEHARIAESARPAWVPDTDLPDRALGFRVQAYGMTKHRDLFSSRQLLALTTLSDLVRECRQRVYDDAVLAGMTDDGTGLERGGYGAAAYADAIVTYLALTVDRLADRNSSLCLWDIGESKIAHVFGRQTLSMVWDFAEANVLGDSSGSLSGAIDLTKRALASASAAAEARVFEQDAAADWLIAPAMVCTDPPYYDNVPYADLSDFFYVWLRASLKDVYPGLLGLVLVPKTPELIAEPARFSGDAEKARQFFENGLRSSFRMIRRAELPDLPTTVFYAFKQAKSTAELERDGAHSVGRSSVGWEAMLAALLGSGFQISGTWPVRTELANRMRGQNSNALASSIVLVGRPRSEGATRCTRAEFLQELRAELPIAVKRLRDASLAATDIEQASIGPGMAVFSRYTNVLEPDGSNMSIRSALAVINQELAQILLGEIADVDAETHFALAWFDGHFYEEAKYGEAEVLLKAKNANLNILRESGTVRADRGLVQILRPSELDAKRLVGRDGRARSMPAWAQLMFLVAAITSEDGGTDAGADALLAIGSSVAERLKDLAYHCYLACDKAKRSAEAQDFNAVVTAWPDLQKLAQDRTAQPSEQRLL